MISTVPDLAGLHVFCGAADQALARVYARVSSSTAGDYQLAGAVTGPTCLYSETLSAHFPLADRGPGPALLAEATIPDPCFWSDELPFLYRIDVELKRGDAVVDRTRRWLGIKRLGTIGRRIMLEGRNWVVRGVREREVGRHPIATWNEAAAAMIVDDPEESLLKEASIAGVWIMAHVSRQNLAQGDAIEKLARWPAVALAILPSQAMVDSATRLAARNLLLAEEFGPGQSVTPSPWAQVVVCHAADAEDLAYRAGNCNLPTIARRDIEPAASIREGRAGCDRLQRDLAGRGEFAGYIV